MIGLKEKILEAAASIQKVWSEKPKIGLILGTGLGGLAEQIDDAAKIAYEDIPHFPRSTVKSHAGQLVCGELSGHQIVAMEGRFHYYEGYSMEQVTFPVRVMRELGCDILVVTNAAGGLNPQFSLADVMVIEDHIDWLPDNPLRGVNDDSLGPRFPDMSDPYHGEYIQLAREAARDLKIPTQQGVLVAVSGPNLETRAEYRMLRGFGADTVAMSTIPEVITANHAGMKVIGFSIVTDLCLPDALEPVELEKILAVAAKGGAHLAKLIPEVLKRIK